MGSSRTFMPKRFRFLPKMRYWDGKYRALPGVFIAAAGSMTSKLHVHFREWKHDLDLLLSSQHS